MQNEFFRGAINPGDCVSNAWNLVKQNYGLFIAMVLVGGILAGCIPCVSLFLAGPILAGFYHVFLMEMNGEPADFGALFKGFDVFVPTMVVGIILAIPEIIGQGVRVSVDLANFGLTREGAQSGEVALASGLVIFAFLFAIGVLVLTLVLRVSMFFTLPLIIERKMAVGDAIKLSASAAWGNLGGIILLFLLEVLLLIAGCLACIIGLLFVAPIIYAANAFAYRQVFPKTDQTFQNVPPPPTAYDTGFGRGM
ncbi:MAG: hypothetical protein R2747_20260 [Pyrinomonadaceae bacterium]